MAEKKPDNKQENAVPSPVPKPQKIQEAPIPESVSRGMEEIMRRLRLLEERYAQTRKKSQFTEQSMLDDTKNLFDEIGVLGETLSELKSEIADLSDKLSKLDEEVRQSVSKADVNVLSKYLDYWQPMEFLTRKDAEKILEKQK